MVIGSFLTTKNEFWQVRKIFFVQFLAYIYVIWPKSGIGFKPSGLNLYCQTISEHLMTLREKQSIMAWNTSAKMTTGMVNKLHLFQKVNQTREGKSFQK